MQYFAALDVFSPGASENSCVVYMSFQLYVVWETPSEKNVNISVQVSIFTNLTYTIWPEHFLPCPNIFLLLFSNMAKTF